MAIYTHICSAYCMSLWPVVLFRKARRVDKFASLSNTKKNTAGELEKTEQYLTDLKPACVNGDSSYEERHTLMMHTSNMG